MVNSADADHFDLGLYSLLRHISLNIYSKYGEQRNNELLTFPRKDGLIVQTAASIGDN